MIGVRDDDVLISSSSYDSELGRFKQVHEWICEVPETLIHVPTILVTEIQQFPEAIDFVRQETAEGRMMPEIHGLEHKDYSKLTFEEIGSELNQCRDWIYEQFGHEPTKFYSPWGAGFKGSVNGAHIRPAAAAVGIELVTCEYISKLNGRYGVVKELSNGRDISYLENTHDKEIFMHWWEGGSRLKRVVEVIKHGSWEEAAKQNRKLFNG
jgi:peptidoglycan/xylan/chitin deacetylase (PgdA/CDA1 family)